jgi:serine/threonine-protein kinase HipA
MGGMLFVHREFKGSYQLVGILDENAGIPIFTYVPEYLENADAAPISSSLPLVAEAFSPDVTSSFFSGIIPEGQLNRREQSAATTLRFSIWFEMNLLALLF